MESEQLDVTLAAREDRNKKTRAVAVSSFWAPAGGVCIWERQKRRKTTKAQKGFFVEVQQKEN